MQKLQEKIFLIGIRIADFISVGMLQRSEIMNAKHKAKALSVQEIDKIVIAQVNDDSKWEKPLRVRMKKKSSVPVPSELAARAAFFARLHREVSVDDWLKRIIRERIELEEAALAGLKRDLSVRKS